MPTPNRYTEIALKLSAHKSRVLMAAGLGFAFIFLSIFSTAKLHLKLFAISGLGLLLFVWGWGLFLVTTWFKGAKQESKLATIMRSAFRWYAAIFLDIWFVIGSLAALRVIWNL